MRENTERPITVTHGTNRVVGTDPVSILSGWREVDRVVERRRGSPPLSDVTQQAGSRAF